MGAYAGDCRLLENYIRFMEYFRGAVQRHGDRLEVRSDRKEFTMLFPLKGLTRAELLEFPGSVITLPWVEAAAEQSIQESGLSKKGEYVFMSKPVTSSQASGEFHLRLGETVRDIENFSLVQGRGFLESEAAFKDWQPWLQSANLRNIKNDDCKFLLAESEGEIRSVSLLVEAKDSCGIYAVATPPEHRKKGFSTFLLNASEQIAKDAGHEDVCLQVAAGTYAHSLYSKLGFKEDYRIGFWRH
jgi:GNAT superfamily N-acetyltransferase